MVDAGTRNTLAAKSQVSFTQDVAGAYRYVKTLRLVPGKPQLVIEHALTNNSRKPFLTTAYDHNFLQLTPGNQDLAVSLPFAVKPDKKPDAAINPHFDGNRICLVSKPAEGQGSGLLPHQGLRSRGARL